MRSDQSQDHVSNYACFVYRVIFFKWLDSSLKSISKGNNDNKSQE